MLWKSNPFWASVVGAFGGLAMIHAIHYLVMWFFVASVLFHIYLVLFDDFKSFLSMFFGIKPEEEEAY
jgi:Ni,Fe-hydrogenase I cytochrome b subunit